MKLIVFTFFEKTEEKLHTHLRLDLNQIGERGIRLPKVEVFRQCKRTPGFNAPLTNSYVKVVSAEARRQPGKRTQIPEYMQELDVLHIIKKKNCF